MAVIKRHRLPLLFLLVASTFSVTTLYMGYSRETVYVEDSDALNDDIALHHDDYENYRGSGKVIDTLKRHSHGEMEKNSLAAKLYKTVPVLCWIMTAPKNLDKKARAVQKTWAKHFNTHLFISSETNTSFPTIGLNVSEGRQHLTAKTMKAFRYVYDHHFNDADWFMKADDDTFVIAENLRFFLSHYSPHDPIYFGYHFKPFVSQGYMSGGAGYVLSKAALKLLVETNTTKLCRQDGGAEDAEMGKCLAKIGVKAGESLDKEGRETFHPFKPIVHMEGHFPEWFLKYAVNRVEKGYGCCSDYTITFHYMSPADMYLLDFMLYHLRPFGLQPEVPNSRVFATNHSSTKAKSQQN
ncbi:LOW QUALITY PROTEIN: glycoprotein-N-acetylgalactosamine 3-beta-galactosyltransferase 1-B-like [Liolophura sinensis]|uniref:LOW QUALITY PROTEIN: glycoprotein-N-acetylgalactosamine 3-beta-galactosyltransferase 1-B-like n=1 Tax=Liolophura sinensis TaxID=3198878 RepID=UPI003158F94D